MSCNAEMYRVSWYIDIEAASPRAAAERALEIQRNPDSLATVFEISDEAGYDVVQVDLSEGFYESPGDV